MAQARRFVGAALAGAAPDLVATAQLLVSELVTNVVLHARTEAEVTARSEDGTVRVRVGDRRPDRALVPHGWPPYAGTGQGLPLVARLASRRGVETGDRGKTVWFELGPEGPPRRPDDWEPLAAPADGEATVTLLDVPTALCAAAEQHRHTLLREVTLAVAAGQDVGVTPRDAAVAHDTSQLITASVTAALRPHPAERGLRSLPLSLPPDAGPSVRTLRAVLDLAEEAAREEHLLTLPALPRQRLFHQWLFDQIVGQLAGGHPTAWTVVPGGPGAGPSELVAWDAGQVQASRVPTIAADERNRIIAVNGPAADLLGWNAGDLVGRPLTTLVPEHLRARHATAFTSLLLSGQPRILGRSVPLPALHHDGRLVPVRLFVQPQETADGRTVFVAQLTPRGAVPSPSTHLPGRIRPPIGQRQPDRSSPMAAEDTGRSADRSALVRLSLLADTAAALSNAPYLDEGLERVGRILTDRLADWCAVDLFTEDARVERARVVHRSSGDAWPEEYQGRLPPLSDAARGPLARALRGAGPLLLTGPPSPSQVASPLDAHYLGLFRTMGADSAVVAPLRVRRQIIGALTVAPPRTGRAVHGGGPAAGPRSGARSRPGSGQPPSPPGDAQHRRTPAALAAADTAGRREPAARRPLRRVLRHRAGRRRLVRLLPPARREHGAGHRRRHRAQPGRGDHHEPTAQHAAGHRRGPSGAAVDRAAPSRPGEPQSLPRVHRHLHLRPGQGPRGGALAAGALLRGASAAVAHSPGRPHTVPGGGLGAAAGGGPARSPPPGTGRGPGARDGAAVHRRADRTPGGTPGRRHGAAARARRRAGPGAARGVLRRVAHRSGRRR
ncbi:DNA-binding protein [Streptomyces griseoflavus Tu4000]|uniref:DNA-binding protein n=1 Tax=Streptomyces griseoflavus Tu4000 TaxID=467200 RepID=D9XKC7_9ACTN|nr:DNA-binding protein [Streptomyces griseoflavus Tu4000]